MKKLFMLVFIFLCFILMFEVKISSTTLLCDKAKSAILIDEQTGTILFEKNKDFRLAPASMTKIMSMAIIFDYIKAGHLKYTDIIVTSAYAKSMDGTKIFLDVGERMSVDDMLKGIAIASANDATVAIAEKIAGSEALFVELMNNKAKELSLQNTNFVDSTGLTSKNHYTSAYDMAIMSKYLLNNHKEDVLRYTNVREDYLRKDSKNPFWLVNTNKLIGKYDGVDGLKTGWTNEAGYCLATTMQKEGHRLISVVMGYEVSTIRNSQSVELLNYGFANYKFKEILAKNHEVLEISDIKYNPDKFKVVTSRSVNSIEKLNDTSKTYRYEVKLDDLKPTYKQGDKVGEYLIYCNDVLYDTVDLIVIEDVSGNNLMQLVLKLMKLIFS